MLTLPQQKSLVDTHHVSVTANAGSGKTRVLVERYLHVLLNGKATVGEVVALTYTEKAASELKRRIADRVSKGMAEAAGGTAAAILEAIRNQLSLAPIHTIHAFCSRLLREHPVEAGVDASFSVLEGVDRRILLQETLGETFQAILRPGAASRNELLEVLGSIGKPAVLRTVAMMVEKREQFERLTGDQGLYHREDEGVLERWLAALSDALLTSLADPGLKEGLARAIAAAGGKSAVEARDLFGRFDRAASLREKAADFKRLLEVMIRKDGGWYVSFIGKQAGDAVAGDEAGRLAEWRALLLPLLPVVIAPEESGRRHLLLLARTRTLLAVARQALERYDQKKQESGHLDFDDLQMRMRRLLDHEPVRARLARRFKYIMVDEYQDTNLLQYEILLPLLDRLAAGNLFIVGDPKQSIYGFRNADVRVFERTKQDMRMIAGPAADVVLEESFRPLRDLAAFVNLVFSRLMGEGAARQPDGTGTGTGSERYDPLVRARQNDAPGRVEILLTGTDATSEEDLIARRILRLREEGAQVFDSDERSRDARFGDVAVLLRSRASLPAVEDAFIRYRVPYVVSAGVGYFQTQDVYDFYNYFRFLLNPADDLALSGILRSPFFAISDATLYELSHRSSEGTLWDRLREMARTHDAPRDLQRTAETLREDLDVGLRLPVPELIAWIVRRTLYLAKVAGTVRGDQARANLEKLQRMARSYEATGLTNLYDFVRRMARLIDEEEREGQGEIESRQDAVQIMTVHAAKGLEFPIVVLPHLQRKFRYDGEPVLDDRLGIGFTPDPGEQGDVPLVSFLLEQNRRKTLAEEKRIFYVACTRARDMLILSANPASERAGPDYLRWLLEALHAVADGPAEELSYPVTTRCLRLVEGRFESGEERHTLIVHIVRSVVLQTQEGRSAGGRAPSAAPLLMIEPLVRMPKGETYSASRIRTYKECPYQYYLRYVLGLTEERLSPRSDEEDRSEIPGDLRGRLFHGLMQVADLFVEDPSRMNSELRRLLALEENLEARFSSTVPGDIQAMITGVLASPLWREIAASVERRMEFTISAPFAEDFLTGTVDLVFRDRTGLWHVLDYKTDDVKAPDLQRRAERYWSQLEFYAYLVHKFTAADTVESTILFTSVPDQPLSKRYEKSDMFRFEEQLREVIARIRRQEFAPRGSPCAGCLLRPDGCQAVAEFRPAG